MLLDALEALRAQREAAILVGAQAVYLHTGEIDLTVPEFHDRSRARSTRAALPAFDDSCRSGASAAGVKAASRAEARAARSAEP